LVNFSVLSHPDIERKKIGPTENVIINLDESTDQSGTHWVAVCNLKRLGNIIYFDSFGISPSDDIAKYLKSSGKKIVYNNGQIQAISSVLCGYYCIYILDKLNQGKSYESILSKFDDNGSSSNEYLMKKIIKNNYLRFIN
jgi:hypothetical protein